MTKEKPFQNITYKSADLLDMFAPANIINQIGVLVSVLPVIRERPFYAPVTDLAVIDKDGPQWASCLSFKSFRVIAFTCLTHQSSKRESGIASAIEVVAVTINTIIKLFVLLIP